MYSVWSALGQCRFIKDDLNASIHPTACLERCEMLPPIQPCMCLFSSLVWCESSGCEMFHVLICSS